EKAQPHYIDKTIKYGGGDIKLWGCIISSGVGYRVKMTKYLTSTSTRVSLRSIYSPQLKMIKLTLKKSSYNRILTTNIQLNLPKNGLLSRNLRL
ncbi:hypothetical protein BJ085DRAFT_14182, partial [Dimargaris cristalligena]